MNRVRWQRAENEVNKAKIKRKQSERGKNNKSEVKNGAYKAQQSRRVDVFPLCVPVSVSSFLSKNFNFSFLFLRLVVV